MKFDYIIIGGGLCGLSAGIRLAAKGKKTAIISSGQSALHFCAGSFGLLGKRDGKVVADPIAEIPNLNEAHPYRIIGEKRVETLAKEVPAILTSAGISTHGDCRKNHLTLTPFGLSRPSWLTFDGYTAFDEGTCAPDKNILLISVKGFLETYPSFAAENLEKSGISCRIETIDLERLARLRESNFDMRAVSVAKQMDEKTIREFADKINKIAKNNETVLIPAILGIESEKPFNKLRDLLNNPVYCIPTIPVSVSGVRAQNALHRYFESLGGTYLLGDHIDKGIIENGKVKAVISTNFGEDHLEADKYILASGFLFSGGIVATPNKFFEPVFGLDIDAPTDRSEWYSQEFFSRQPYMSYGVKIDSQFHPAVEGKTITNLYAAGAALAHTETLSEESGAGTAIITGMHVADLAMGNIGE